MQKSAWVVASAMTAMMIAASLAAPVAHADVSWLCRPGLAANPCEIPLDTTVALAGGGTQALLTPARPPSTKRPVDCFYVYPTVSNQLGLNATKARDAELRSIAEYQAARFSQHCRMFVPIYRQIPLAGIPAFALGSGTGTPARTAYEDVLEAWRAYLRNDNRGRGVVLLGHSQGTMMLRQLIRAEIEAHPEQLRLLVGGVLLGENVTVRNGSTTGGDFTSVPICTRRAEAGCVTAYSTYAADPSRASFFGRDDTDIGAIAFGFPRGADHHVACTDPGALSGITTPVGITIPSTAFAAGAINLGIAITIGGTPPTAPTTWVEPADRYAGSCREIDGSTVYRYDPVGAQSRRPNEFPPAWGTHLVDMNLGLERLTAIVGEQASTWLGDHLSVGRATTDRSRGRAILPITVPGAGTITITRTRQVAAARRTTTRPSTVRLVVAPRGAALRAMRRTGSMRVRVTVTYYVAGQASGTRAVTVRLRIVR